MSNVDYTQKYDVAGDMEAGLLGRMKNFTVATLTDVATTLWNSLPLTPEVTTEEALNRIDSDALQYYSENPDAVKMTSLIGGSIVPGAVALKLLNRARTGLTSMGLAQEGFVGGSFTGARQKMLTSEIENAFRAAGAGTSEFNALKRQLYASGAAQQVMDNAVIELAVVGAMNAHPYMEDYTASTTDFIKNFALGATVGGVLGAGFSIPTSTKILRDATSKIEIQAAANVLESGFKPVALGMTSSSRVKLHTENIKILEGLVADKTTDDYIKTMLVNILGQETKQLDDTLMKAMPSIAKDDHVMKGVLRELMTKPELEGVDRIRFINMDKVDKNTAKSIVATDIDPTFVDTKGKAVVAFYRPSTGEVFHATGARNAALVADLTNPMQRVRTLSAEYKKQYASPINDFIDDIFLRSKSSAQIDLRYVAEMHAMDTLDVHQLKQVIVGPQDLPRLHGLVSRVQKLSPEEASSLKILVTSDKPSYSKQQTIIKKIIEDEKTVAPTYWDDITRVHQNSDNLFERGHSSGTQLSTQARELLDFWKGGSTHTGKSALREFPLESSGRAYGDIENDIGMQAFRLLYNHVTQGAALPKGMSHWVPGMEEIIRFGAKFKEELRPHADVEGYIYLYRGTNHKQQGSNIYSYSFNPRTASGFGKPFLARIHVDDVIGAFPGENEIVVRSHSPDIKTALPIAKSQTTEHLDTLIEEANAAEGRQLLSLGELPAYYFNAASDIVRDMVQKGFSLEEISARTNMHKDGILEIIMGASENIGWHSFRYQDPKKIGEYIDVRNKMLAMIGNPDKNPSASAFSSLDRKTSAVYNKQLTENLTLESSSVVAKRISGIYQEPGAKAVLDKLSDDLATVVNSMTGNFRWQSADQMLRAMEIGPIITGLGQRFITTTDQLKKEILEPLAVVFQGFREDSAALVGFNRVLNKLAGLKGWRDIVPVPERGDNVWTIVQREKVKGKWVYTPIKDDNGGAFLINQAKVYEALDATRKISNEALSLHNLNRSITGQREINDLGFYVPPVSLVGKSYSYINDTTGGKPIQLLVANTAEELESLTQAWKAANAAELNRYQVFTKGEQGIFSAMNEYNALETHATYANVAYQHKGRTAQGILPSDFRMIENMINSYENLILQGARRYHESYLHDTMYWLDEMSNFYQRSTTDQPKTLFGKELPPKNAPLSVKNILLGRDQLEQSVGLKMTNSLYDFALNKAMATVDKYVRTPGQRKETTEVYFNKLIDTLKNEGAPIPWKSFDEYLATTSSSSRNVSAAVQSAGNGLLATLNLRLFEVTQAAVNIMSLPILTWSALMEKMPATTLGATGQQLKFPLRVSYDGIRFMNSPEGKAINEMWEQRGILNLEPRAFTETVGELKSAYRGGRFSDRALGLVNDLQENPIVKNFLTKPADWAEQMTRRISMNIGYIAAKTAYPGIDDFGASIAAMNFMNRSIGNYHAAQRPGLFQGTLGAAIGLYQTYMVTYAQGIYRGLENRNFKQLATTALSQSALFGMASWPGYSLLSEHIVSNFNDNHWDLTTGTYRAVGDPMAELILYGLPSSIGPAFYTRGDVSPRVPTSLGEVAMYNGIRQGWEAAATIVSKTAEGIQNRNVAQSLFEALSLQSLNRPIARWSELVTGESITRQGNTVSPSSEVWTPVGIASRLIGTRPMEEQVVRNAIYSNKFYESMDHENRQEAVQALKTGLRSSNMPDSLVSETALKYMRAGGTAKGWASAMNEILMKTEDGARLDLLRKIEPGSPVRTMIDDLY